MKVFSSLTLVTLAASFRGIVAVSECLDSAGDDYRCTFDERSTKLNLEACGITDFDVAEGLLQKCFDEFGPSKIENLRLHFNELAILPDGVFDGLGSLEILLLNHNRLTELPDGVFDALGGLKVLFLHQNELTKLPDGVFDKLITLEEMNLSHNGLSELSEGVFDKPVALKALYLGSNGMKKLPAGVFDSLESLETLYVNINELKELPDGIFDSLTSLENLSLVSNELTTLPDGIFDSLGYLRSLYLSSNELTTLPNGVFDALESLVVLVLDGNELECRPATTARLFTLERSIPDVECEPSPEHGGQTCSNGISGVEGTTGTGLVACCPTTCLNGDGEPECGGPGCRKRQGGKRTCCIEKINRSGEDCADSNNAPCFIVPGSTSGSTCDGGIPGIQTKTVCCPASCGSCGGSGCSERDGGDFAGSDACCESGVKSLDRVCSADVGAPCVVP